jgi:cytochrome c-type biogenesis protein CcmE
VAYVAAQALSTATTFFYNADEAVAQQPKLGTGRFRMQGTVEPGTIQSDGTDVTFKVTFNGAEVAVVHQGDPPELFKGAMPVVLEGHWDADGTHFDSDRMLVKHDANYVAKNGDRLKQADDGGTVPPTTAPPVPPSSVAPAGASAAVP